MFRNSYQNGLLSIFYSCGSRPLRLWSKNVKNGYVKRVTDEQVKSLVLELIGNNVVSTYIACPADMSESLGIKLPFLVLIVKNLKKYFTFEIQVLDDKQTKRKFTISNASTQTRIRNFETTIPINMNPGWNNIQLNMAEVTKKAYGTNFVECTRIHIHANCRIRRVFFADKAYPDEELPKQYKLFQKDTSSQSLSTPPDSAGTTGSASEQSAVSKKTRDGPPRPALFQELARCLVLQILDDQEFKRKFHVSNGITKAKINPFVTQLPMTMFPGWNEIQFNVAELTKKAYGTNFVEVRRIHLHANCRLRRIYFADRIYPEDELPDEYKLFASDVPLKPGLLGVGSERRADDKVQLEINAGQPAVTVVN